MSATIGFATADGNPAWNGVFLAAPNWCVPGMPRGGLLPAPSVAVADGQDPLIYGLPIEIVVVKDLNISVKWSGQDRESLNGNDFIGPFSLAGRLDDRRSRWDVHVFAPRNAGRRAVVSRAPAGAAARRLAGCRPAARRLAGCPNTGSRPCSPEPFCRRFVDTHAGLGRRPSAVDASGS